MYIHQRLVYISSVVSFSGFRIKDKGCLIQGVWKDSLTFSFLGKVLEELVLVLPEHDLHLVSRSHFPLLI